MILRIFFKTDKSSDTSVNYLDVSSIDWSASSILLTVRTSNGTVRHYPLCNIESFLEV